MPAVVPPYAAWGSVASFGRGGPRTFGHSGGCRRPGRIVKLRSAALFAAALYSPLLARFCFDFGPTPGIACIVDHRQDMHQIASNRVEHAIRKSR